MPVAAHGRADRLGAGVCAGGIVAKHIGLRGQAFFHSHTDAFSGGATRQAYYDDILSLLLSFFVK